VSKKYLSQKTWWKKSSWWWRKKQLWITFFYINECGLSGAMYGVVAAKNGGGGGGRGAFIFFWNHRDFTRHKVLHKDLLNNAMRLRRWSMIIFLKTIILPIDLLVERLWLWKFTFVQKCWKITHIRLMILEKMPWMFEKWQLATAMCVNNCEDADSIICHWSSWSASWMTHPAWYSMGAGGRAGKS